MNNTINLFNECWNWSIYLDNGMIIPRNQACKPQITNDLEMNCRCKTETETRLIDLCFTDFCNYDFKNLVYIGECSLADFVSEQDYLTACKYIKCRKFTCIELGTEKKAYVIGYLPSDPNNEDCLAYVSMGFYLIGDRIGMLKDVQTESSKIINALKLHSCKNKFEFFSIFFNKTIDNGNNK